MPIPPIPPPLEHLGNRKFSFYPPILNIERNEWTYHQATWSEILVTNVHSGQEVWVPRRFLGEVSRVDDPVLIVGLNKELEYSAGAVWPHRRRVIEMPIAVNDRLSPTVVASDLPKSPAPVIGIKLESTEARTGKMVVGVITVGWSAAWPSPLSRVSLNSGSASSIRPTISPISNWAGMTTTSQWFASWVNRPRTAGAPQSAAVQYRVLGYPNRGYTVVLFGATATARGTSGRSTRNAIQSTESPTQTEAAAPPCCAQLESRRRV